MFKDSNIYIKKNGLWKPVLEQGFWYLHFPGTSGSYIAARDISNFEIGDQNADVYISTIAYENINSHNALFGSTSDTGSTPGYMAALSGSTQNLARTGIKNGTTDFRLYGSFYYYAEDLQFVDIKFEFIQSSGRLSLSRDNGITITDSNVNIANSVIENYSPMAIGANRVAGLSSWAYHGDIRYFRFNDEYFDFSEGGGDTITSNKGTVMDILGDVEWRYQEPVKNVSIHTGLGWKDLIEDEGWYLHFPGDDSSYIQARDKTVFSNIPFPIAIDFKTDTLIGNQYLVGKWGTNSGYAVHIQSGRLGFASFGEGGQPYTIYSTNVIEAESKYTYEVDLDGTDLVQRLGGVEVRRDENYSMSDGEEDFYFTIGTRDKVPRPFTGDLFYLKMGDEKFLMNEGQGTTITGSKGTVMDIKGDVEWRRDNTKSKIKTKK